MQLFLILLFYHLHGLFWSYSETYLLRFLPFCDSFYGYFTYYFCFFRRKCCRSISRKSPFSVHLCTNITWSKKEVNWKLCQYFILWYEFRGLWYYFDTRTSFSSKYTHNPNLYVYLLKSKKRKPDASNSLRHSPQTSAAIM